MANFINLEGRKIGRLVVTGNKEKRGRGKIQVYYWECKCECGKVKFIAASNLTTKIKPTQSCGCLAREISYTRLSAESKNYLQQRKSRPIQKSGIGAAKRLYNHYKRTALKYRNLSFEITFEQFLDITTMNCHYCNKEPYQITKYNNAGRRYNGEYIYNGIDRKVNNKGYLLENCLPCCGRCNEAKMDSSYEEFLKLIKAIYSNLIVKDDD
ncbi:MAG TPA: hypothetical protein VN855_00615 [Candidatus Acidoferrum sp.]|nr:hypothetical protein [Candidatus Acidoferrum sp.]